MSSDSAATACELQRLLVVTKPANRHVVLILSTAKSPEGRTCVTFIFCKLLPAAILANRLKLDKMSLSSSVGTFSTHVVTRSYLQSPVMVEQEGQIL